MLGERVWYVSDGGSVFIKCPVCDGNRKVTTQTADYGEVKIECPRCKGIGSASYSKPVVYDGFVVKSHITLAVGDDAPSFNYVLVNDASALERFKNSGNVYTFSRCEIYKTRKEAEEAANQETEIRKNKAEERVGIK